MSSPHFLLYTRRLEQAGIRSLWVSLGSDKDGNRLMHVSPDAHAPREAAAKFPTRTFLIDGTDPILEQFQIHVTLAPAAELPTILANALVEHPLHAHEFKEWMQLWADSNRATEEEIADCPPMPEAQAEKQSQYLMGLMHGLDAGRASETPNPEPR